MAVLAFPITRIVRRNPPRPQPTRLLGVRLVYANNPGPRTRL